MPAYVLALVLALCGATSSLAGDAPVLKTGAGSFLLERIETATVMVMVETPEGSRFGSGFFVAPDLVVTNAHIAPSGATSIFVTSALLGPPTAATLLASENKGLLKRDLALLRLEKAPHGATPLPLAQGVILEGVYAAGFPELPIHHQVAAFLANGDPLRPRRPTATFGIATSRDEAGDATILTHTAKTSKGSSGGPVVDECGRAVGMASWIRDDWTKAGDYRLNFAQDAAMIRDFLTEQGVAIRLETGFCKP